MLNTTHGRQGFSLQEIRIEEPTSTQYLKQTAESSTYVHVDSLLALTLQLMDSFHKLLQYLHSTENTDKYYC